MALDPQTIPFTPRAASDEYWRFEADIMKVQQTQAEHAERLARLEKRSEENARLKSVWGTSSPFPGVLSGTPQQRAVNQSPADAFIAFDDSSNLIGSLHLDAEEEPRRMGATSRANSVRFDETANQGHWSHPSRTSIDLIPRSTSSMSAHPLLERTYSHKSDGRQSSAGHSVHSVTSGRANSLGIDALFNSIGQSPTDTPGITPGLSILGPVPAIIRCWLTTNFRHDSLLYAAICTGSYSSHIDESLIIRLGLVRSIRTDEHGFRKIRLPVYLPEATVQAPSSSRSSSPAPQLPTLSIDFNITSRNNGQGDSMTSSAFLGQSGSAPSSSDKSIKILIGCDVLQSRRADVLYSAKAVTLFDDDQAKLSIPMVRPEDDNVFKGLLTISNPITPVADEREVSSAPGEMLELKGLQQSLPKKEEPPSAPALDTRSIASVEGDGTRKSSQTDSTIGLTSRPTLEERFGQTAMNNTTNMETSKPADDDALRSSTGSSKPVGIWGANWRREKEEKPAAPPSSSSDWSNRSMNTGYARREQGMKVLRPIKPTSRAVSSTQASAAPSPSTTGQSRFFDDGKRRSSLDELEKRAAPPGLPALGSSAVPQDQTKLPAVVAVKEATNAAAATTGGGIKTRVNPAGGASAFSWMNK